MAAAGLLKRGVLALLLHGAWRGVQAEPAACDADAGDEDSALLQMRAEWVPPPQKPCGVMWRVTPRESKAETCDEVCEVYGTDCVEDGFMEVDDEEKLQRAMKMATGMQCRRRRRENGSRGRGGG
eukprot:CAMPEP_0170393624 /NCGR_PEP_ID=MMETSP0117_2-20130122/20824_1 /TAXON_ID=400756 /ORGANISM="Durinskia baltica, Strain CSIRO CS-38" /LENGTH=124 /DNA_ID=CAMNT_0010649839 /DNA_START=63 /DNA_END=434 /DNA_ORIENTATION=-